MFTCIRLVRGCIGICTDAYLASQLPSSTITLAITRGWIRLQRRQDLQNGLDEQVPLSLGHGFNTVLLCDCVCALIEKYSSSSIGVRLVIVVDSSSREWHLRSKMHRTQEEHASIHGLTSRSTQSSRKNIVHVTCLRRALGREPQGVTGQRV